MDTYTISDAARILKRHVKTLQKWDRDGILKAHRTETNRRYYTEDQLLLFLGRQTEAAKPKRRITEYTGRGTCNTSKRSVVDCRFSASGSES